jgi:hypothetical protein
MEASRGGSKDHRRRKGGAGGIEVGYGSALYTSTIASEDRSPVVPLSNGNEDENEGNEGGDDLGAIGVMAILERWKLSWLESSLGRRVKEDHAR